MRPPGGADPTPRGWSLESRIKELERRASDVYVPIPPFPRNLMLELSNACNHACVFCANPKMTRRPQRMDGELLRSVLEQGHALGAREVGFYTTGDPFVHTDLHRFVALAKQTGYEYTYVSTNGALATPDRSKAVIDAGLDSVKFSINAGSRESYRAIHGADDWDKVVAHLGFISEYRKTLGRDLKLGITYVVIDQNRHETSSFRERFRDLVDDIYFSEGGHQAGYMFENYTSVARESTATPVAAPCYMVFSRAHVTCEGYLTLCCVDYQNYLAVADLRRIALAEAWRHPLFVELRKRHLENRLEGTLCHNCLRGEQAPVEPLVRELSVPFDFAGSAAENAEKQRGRFDSFR